MLLCIHNVKSEFFLFFRNFLKATQTVVHFSETFDDGFAYLNRWTINSSLNNKRVPATLLNGGLNLNTAHVELSANMTSFSTENKTLILQFTVLYENSRAFSGGSVTLLSDRKIYLTYFFYYENSTSTQGIEIFLPNLSTRNWSPTTYQVENAKIPIEHRLIIKPNSSYQIIVNNQTVHADSFENLKNLYKLNKFALDKLSSYGNKNINKIAISFVDYSVNGAIIDNILVCTSFVNFTHENA